MRPHTHAARASTRAAAADIAGRDVTEGSPHPLGGAQADGLHDDENTRVCFRFKSF